VKSEPLSQHITNCLSNSVICVSSDIYRKFPSQKRLFHYIINSATFAQKYCSGITYSLFACVEVDIHFLMSKCYFVTIYYYILNVYEYLIKLKPVMILKVKQLTVCLLVQFKYVSLVSYFLVFVWNMR
jgi:hypothetical protein